MSDERQHWEDLVSRYLRGVRRSLSHVDHPRKKEMLADLRRHLQERYAGMSADERTTDFMAAVIAEMGPPEEYAELLSPASGTAPQVWYRRRYVQLVLAVFVILVMAKTFLLPDVQACERYLRSMLGINFTPAPFFNRTNFNSLQPGMTKDEVRDLVGYPLQRIILGNAKGEFAGSIWSYSTVVDPGAWSYQWFRVEFAADTNQVLRTGDSYENYKQPVPHVQDPTWVKNLKRPIGSLSLERADGTSQVLRKSDRRLYLLYPFSCRKGETVQDSLNRALANAEERFGWLKTEGCSILHVLRMTDGRDVRSSLAKEPFERQSRTFLRSAPDLGRKPGVHLYKEGVLYRLPDIGDATDKGDSDEDQQWLLRRLLL